MSRNTAAVKACAWSSQESTEALRLNVNELLCLFLLVEALAKSIEGVQQTDCSFMEEGIVETTIGSWLDCRIMMTMCGCRFSIYGKRALLSFGTDWERECETGRITIGTWRRSETSPNGNQRRRVLVSDLRSIGRHRPSASEFSFTHLQTMVTTTCLNVWPWLVFWSWSCIDYSIFDIW